MLYFDNFWHTYTLVNFLSRAYFMFSMKLKAENQLKLKRYNAPRRQYVVHVCTTIRLLHHDTPDFITAPHLWLLNIS